MVPTPELRNLEDVLNSQLGNVQVKDFQTRFLTAVGDNYGSTMLALTVLVSQNGKDKKMELVAKMCPTNQLLLDIFQIDITFVKESCIYTVVAPELLKLQLERRVPENEILNTFIRCYGARTSLNPSEKQVDEDAVLILENLKFKGFVVGDRTKGFDAVHTELVLKNLARFHAVPIALRYAKPQVFKEKVEPYLEKINVDARMDKEQLAKMKQVMQAELKSIPEILSLYDVLNNQMEICRERQGLLDFYEESPFNTICHNDFWVNNMLVAYDSHGKPDRIKIFDFQMVMFASLTVDLLFFLFTSVENEYLVENFDNIIRFYYDEFVTSLEINGCPLDDFSYDKFLADLNHNAPYELYHILMMTRVLQIDHKKMSELEEFEDNAFFDENMVGENHYKKLKLIVTEYKKRNWLINGDSSITQ